MPHPHVQNHQGDGGVNIYVLENVQVLSLRNDFNEQMSTFTKNIIITFVGEWVKVRFVFVNVDLNVL